uniref:Putative secreted protein n=1 Tax=Ixodes ricinus TaxID=34613 RepID=A0A6B0U338_IXORI
MNGKQNVVLSLSSPLALITLCVRNVITLKPSRPLLPQSCFCLKGILQRNFVAHFLVYMCSKEQYHMEHTNILLKKSRKGILK